MNMKDIKDYLHLYLGCEVQVNLHLADVVDRYKIGRLIGAYIDQWENGNYHPTVQVDWGYPDNRGYYHLHRVKPILRPLSDMTEEEKGEFKRLIPWIDFEEFSGDDRWRYHEHEQISKHETRPVCLVTASIDTMPLKVVPFLISRSFDLFGLIKEGLAIDATKIKKP